MALFDFSDAVNNLIGGAGAAAGLNQAIGNIQDLRGDIMSQAQNITGQASQAAEFQPFTVTSGAGQIGIGPQGGATLTPGQQQLTEALQARAAQGVSGMGASPLFGQISEQALQQAQAGLGQATPTAQSLFEQMQATRQGEQERARLELENRLAAQGRLGTQTAAYGGTPEQLAMQKAIQEQQSADLLSATTLAPQLAQQQLAQTQGLFGLGQTAASATPALEQAQLANISGQLGTAFTPTQQLLATFAPAGTAAQLAQSGRASEAQALGQLGPTVLESMQRTGETEAGLQQAQVNAILAGLGFANPANQGTEQTLADAIKDALGMN